MPSFDRPIFIVGAGRSGTTLLRSLLSAHPRIAIPPETHFMKRCDAEGTLAAGAPADFEAFWARYTASTRFKDLGVNAADCRGMIAEGNGRTFRSVLVAVLAAYGRRLGKPRVGEKTPGHVFYVRRLLEWFPDACILVVRRDPRAVVASQLLAPWNTSQRRPLSLREGLIVRKRLHDVAVEAGRWMEVYAREVPSWEADPRVLVVGYERLVTEAAQELQRICAFIGEPFNPGMLTNRSKDTVPAATAAMRDVPEAWRRQHYEMTLRPVSTETLDKWKQELSRLDVAIVEGRCARGMRALGYERSQSAPARAIGRLAARAILAGAWAEERLRAAVRSISGRSTGLRQSLQ